MSTSAPCVLRRAAAGEFKSSSVSAVAMAVAAVSSSFAPEVAIEDGGVKGRVNVAAMATEDGAGGDMGRIVMVADGDCASV